MGARGGCRTGSRTPEMRRPQGLRGLPLDAPLRRFCSHCASPGSAWKRQELRFARLAGRKDGRAGYRFPPSTRTARPQCPPYAPTLAPHPRAKASGGRSSLQALPADPEQPAKESGGGGRRDQTCRPGVCGSAAPGCPCQAVRPPAAGYLPRSTSAPRRRQARGAARAAGAGELPDRERDKPFAKPRVHSSAGPPG